jgi:FkbH-like protein
MLTFKDLKRSSANVDPKFPVKKLALLGDTATQFLKVAIKGMGAVKALNLDIWEADFNQVERQVFDPSSELHEAGADYVVVFQSTHKLLEKFSRSGPAGHGTLADDRLNFVKALCGSVNGKIIYFNYPEIDDTVFGSYANKVSSSFTYQLRKLNMGLMDIASANPNFFVCDIAALQNKYGRDYMFDTSIYMNTEMVLSLDILPLVASRTLDIICAIEGKFKKCVILDLDNTVWGGIVGDDGWENVQVGHGLGIGKAFTEFQEWVKKLKERGIILAVCSKNDEANAKAPFEKNPEMVLKLEDIAVFVANWENKADNIRRIQHILNIGFDSMVFLDDNPFERNLVRQNIPDITVPELPEDPGEYLEYLYSLNLFETASFSQMDAQRTEQYQVEAKRSAFQSSFTNEAEFLKSLNMTSEVRPFDSFNTARVAQLSQRSNQFNLRTVRYTEAEIAAVGKDENALGLSFTLVDQFGDNGLICAIILRRQNDANLFIDTWFMSCRVLKRGMENFTLNTIVAYAKEKGYKYLIGEYLPTSKNKMVEKHYPNLGFTARGDQYVLEVDSYQPRESFIEAK